MAKTLPEWDAEAIEALREALKVHPVGAAVPDAESEVWDE